MGGRNLAAVLGLPPSASPGDVWDLVGEGLSHPAAVRYLAVLWL